MYIDAGRGARVPRRAPRTAERIVVETVGRTQERRELVLVTAKLPREPESPPPLRILVNANIHAGEVEGKEAVQMILRELASGEHEALLRGADLMFLPVYNTAPSPSPSA